MHEEERPTLPSDATVSDPTAADQSAHPTGESAGGRARNIGKYRLLGLVGEGGMGEVWEAEQLRPVHRTVALKLIKLGMDTRQVVARFEAERQVLAVMDHPSIAKVFDGGATKEGRPYFVMEFVPGAKITAHCDANELDTESRLKLFIDVCEGVQHAHQKAIIHRDLKPSNVLITKQDDKDVPKIIDFGIAKATDDKADGQMLTRFGAPIGTPEYMSPEQLEGRDIDTRTDVYALGVILYELLVGVLPIEGDRSNTTSFEDLCRSIRKEDPVLPSTRVTELGSSAEVFASTRRLDTRSMIKKLRGELDWIIMKTLEKDRARRYASPRELAADIQRYLDLEPVLAGPPSKTYRLGKFVRRHKAGVLAGAFMGVALLTGLTAATWGFLRATRAEADARSEAAKSQAVNQFLQEMLASVNPAEAKGDEVTVREVLDEASQQVGGGETSSQQEVEAAVRNTIGSTYQALGLYDDAEPHLRSALETRRTMGTGDDPDVAESLHNLGRLLWEKSDYDGAEPLIRDALDMNRRLFGDEHEAVLQCLGDLAVVVQSRGNYVEAEPMFREALDLSRKLLGERSPMVADHLNNLAWVLRFNGELAEAEQLFREALALTREILGETHPNVLIMRLNLASILDLQGDREAAESEYRATVRSMKEILGEEHSVTLRAVQSLAELYLKQEKVDEAEPLLRDALATAERTLGPDHNRTISLVADLGWVHRVRGDLAQAEPYYRETLARRERSLGEDHPLTIRASWQVCRVLVDRGKYTEAAKIGSDALEICRRVLPEGNENLSSTLVYLGLAYVGEGRPAEAEPLLRECLEARTRTFGDDRWEVEQARSGLGAAMASQGRFEEAEPILLSSYEKMSADETTPPIRVRNALKRIVDLYEGWSRAEPGTGKAVDAARWRGEWAALEGS